MSSLKFVLALSLTLTFAFQSRVGAQGISEMGAVHSMGATMGAGLHSQSGAATGGLNSVYGSINKQLGGAAGAAGGGSVDIPTDALGMPIDPRLTVQAAGKESNRLYNLAVQKQKAGKNVEAEALYKKSIAVRQAIWGTKDPAVTKLMSTVAGLMRKRGDLAGAETWYRSILKAELKRYGAGTYELVPTLEKLGQVSLEQKKYADAQNFLQQVYTQRSRKFGLDNAETIAAALELSRAYSESGDLTDAAEILSKTVDAKLNDSGSPQMIKLLEAYMSVLKKQNKQEEFTRIESRLQTMKPVPVAKSEAATGVPTASSDEVKAAADANLPADGKAPANAKAPADVKSPADVKAPADGTK